MAERLISAPKPRLEASACHLDRPCYRVVATVPEDIREVMPYVNAVSQVLLYEPDEPVIIFRLLGYRVALRPREITVGTVADWEEAQRALSEVVEYLNKIWAERQKISPDTRPKRRPPALEIYKLLPRTNCGQCGEVSCLAFATKLALGKLELEACEPLNKDVEARKRLLKLIGAD
ncbi:hypothetical protein G4V39_10605 [Thermosulfuriphilus ammonigenes]|uniref:Uncharacterized protein n=1 Tax=Thermosulfuriphilus ammonigenes TaxID=1936021 RepID=A0A6G7PZ27_9BACT|nr:(Fe-S)-binding protein [Thermosulfuriphilus ammonigenes]MBA2849009.1 ArsR family metal-binding transcriptional regulator [Thermosulfuriphilus ammonigenes]QIJ72698.1 hypothetical protein G4V39_10605 [Thermosulfuriphilus ammonigenes]